jgi:hypothetical protein
MYKLIQFASYFGIGFTLASHGHYLFSLVDGLGLKILLYSLTIIIAIIGITLDDLIADATKISSEAIIIFLACSFTGIFIGGSYRAFCLNEIMEGSILALIVGFFWLSLAIIYVRMLIGLR